MVELEDRVLQLPVQDDPVGHDDDLVEDRLVRPEPDLRRARLAKFGGVGGGVQGGEPVSPSQAIVLHLPDPAECFGR